MFPLNLHLPILHYGQNQLSFFDKVKRFFVSTISLIVGINIIPPIFYNIGSITITLIKTSLYVTKWFIIKNCKLFFLALFLLLLLRTYQIFIYKCKRKKECDLKQDCCSNIYQAYLNNHNSCIHYYNCLWIPYRYNLNYKDIKNQHLSTIHQKTTQTTNEYINLDIQKEQKNFCLSSDFFCYPKFNNEDLYDNEEVEYIKNRQKELYSQYLKLVKYKVFQSLVKLETLCLQIKIYIDLYLYLVIHITKIKRFYNCSFHRYNTLLGTPENPQSEELRRYINNISLININTVSFHSYSYLNYIIDFDWLDALFILYQHILLQRFCNRYYMYTQTPEAIKLCIYPFREYCKEVGTQANNYFLLNYFNTEEKLYQEILYTNRKELNHSDDCLCLLGNFDPYDSINKKKSILLSSWDKWNEWKQKTLIQLSKESLVYILDYSIYFFGKNILFTEIVNNPIFLDLLFINHSISKKWTSILIKRNINECLKQFHVQEKCKKYVKDEVQISTNFNISFGLSDCFQYKSILFYHLNHPILSKPFQNRSMTKRSLLSSQQLQVFFTNNIICNIIATRSIEYLLWYEKIVWNQTISFSLFPLSSCTKLEIQNCFICLKESILRAYHIIPFDAKCTYYLVQFFEKNQINCLSSIFSNKLFLGLYKEYKLLQRFQSKQLYYILNNSFHYIDSNNLDLCKIIVSYF